MSVVLVPLTFEDWLESIYGSLPDSKKGQLKKTVYLLNQEVFEPILDAKDKEKVIDQCLDRFMYYLFILLSPITPQTSKIPTAELLPSLYRQIRQLIKKRIKDPIILSQVLEVIDICEEHDMYSSKIFVQLAKNMEFLETLEIEEYGRVIFRMMLALNILMMALERKESVAELSEVLKKYADQLEPFVAALQIHMEPKLSHLKKKATKESMENAKDYRGSMLALEG